MSSDVQDPGPPGARSWRRVSIPSSSGHVFGLMAMSTADQQSPGFNPLVIGACLRTRHEALQVDPVDHTFQSPRHRGMSSDMKAQIDRRPEVRQVSIPSSSGHVFGQRVRCKSRRGSLDVSIPSSSGHVFGRVARAVRDPGTVQGFQSPRHRGMSSDRPTGPAILVRQLDMFQSPRHRGMSSDTGWAWSQYRLG